MDPMATLVSSGQDTVETFWVPHIFGPTVSISWPDTFRAVGPQLLVVLDVDDDDDVNGV